MAKFVWNIEELKYKDKSNDELYKIAENGQYTIQEMQDAIDEYGIGTKCKFIMEKHRLFEAEKDTIKKQKDRYTGREEKYYNTNSLNAWCKKNGVSQGGYLHSAGEYCLYGEHINVTWDDDTINKRIPYIFSRFLQSLKSEEKEYFEDHDEYSIKIAMIKENHKEKGLPYPFKENVKTSIFFDGRIYDEKTKVERKLTLEELNKIIVFQNAVANAIKNVFDTQNPNIQV